MLNPILTNLKINFSDAFFPDVLTEKYNKFLFHKNYPIKIIGAHIYESIQNVEIPGINLQELVVNAMPNSTDRTKEFTHTTINKKYPGTAPINDIVESSQLIVTLRNSILNYMYFYEICHRYYNRIRTVEDFDITLTMMDSAEIDMIRFNLGSCYISSLPGLSFSMNSGFNETKTIDIGFTFNSLSVDFIIPGFDVITIKLK